MPMSAFPIVSILPRLTPTVPAIESSLGRAVAARIRLEKTMNRLAWRAMRRSRDSMRKRTVKAGKRFPSPSVAPKPPHSLRYETGHHPSAYPMRTILYQQFGLFTWRVGVAPFAPMARKEESRRIPVIHETGGTNTKSRWKYHGRTYGHRLPRTRAAKDAYLRHLRMLFRTEDPTLSRRLRVWREVRTLSYPPRPYLIPGANKAIAEFKRHGELPWAVGVYFR